MQYKPLSDIEIITENLHSRNARVFSKKNNAIAAASVDQV